MKGSECESHLPKGMIARVRLHADPGRTVIISTNKTRVEMIRESGDEGFMIFWHTELVGWIACWKQGVEKTMKTA